MLIKWSWISRKDILDIISFHILQNDGETGLNAVASIVESTEVLRSFPLSGRMGRVNDTRELVLKRFPYVVIYRILNDHVEIVRVFHTSRLFPESFFENEKEENQGNTD